MNTGGRDAAPAHDLSPVGRIGMALLLLIALLAGRAQPAPGEPASEAPESLPAIEVHVAPDGNDQWSGRLRRPNQERTDGPLASLSAARDAARRLRAAFGRPVPINILVQGGRYRLNEPLILDPRDSGTSNAPVIITAAPGERPVFSGGELIAGFRPAGDRWEAELPEVKAGRWYFRQLWVNGERRPRARSPNTGYHRIAGLLPGPPRPNALAVMQDRFQFEPGDLRPWDRLGDVNVILMHSWETSIHPVKTVDATSNIVELAAPLKEWWGLGYWERAQRYYVENALELLDQPGEWYLNRETGILTYWPRPGERLGEVEIVAPRLREFVRLAGNADQGEFVDHVTLQGLAFHHADWELHPNGNSSTQAAVEVPAVVTANGARHCAIEGCEIAHIGTYGIWFRRGCKDGRIQRNRLFDLGAGGIRLGEPNMARSDAAETSRIWVDNNHLFAGGRVYAGAVGVWLAHSSHNRVSHNDIHDLYYTGISVGWNWGFETNRTHHNVIEFNHVHNLVHGVLSDAGLIYCLGVSPGSVIRNNVLHDIWPYATPAFGWGIYLDAKCGGYLVESNLVYNTRSGGLMFNNGGHAHTIRHNIFALSAEHALWPYSAEQPTTFRHNIVYLTQGDLLIPNGEWSLGERIARGQSIGDWNDNLYWHTGQGERLRFYRHRFGEWQRLGLDRNSRVADPLFVKAAGHDFRLRPESPAFELGFREPDLSRVGLYGDESWTREASHSRCEMRPLPPPTAAPPPFELEDGFEETRVGEKPRRAMVQGEERGASIRVTEERAASGSRSLKVTDVRELTPSWQPHFYYQPRWDSGIARHSFDLWLGPRAEVIVEWRDLATFPQNIGPSLRFDAQGEVQAGGRVLTRVPREQWIRVEIEAALTDPPARSFRVALDLPGGERRVFSDLPIPGSHFQELHWLGFISVAAADAVFYLDNLRLSR
ncbi:MAG: right-handed parallel beta-helix repeat-containing protein [Verrucomicrobia bacterium]|nr:right-handed parallel beta-helix repeat-containing protein [Verrucomicrobiota bacterium]